MEKGILSDMFWFFKNSFAPKINSTRACSLQVCINLIFEIMSNNASAVRMYSCKLLFYNFLSVFKYVSFLKM